MGLFKKKPSGNIEYLIVGLGNPGAKYEMTRHNVGFMFIDRLADRMNAKITKVKFKGLMGECTIDGVKCLLLKPSTYMNLSGESVKEASSFYKIPPENVIVCFDDTSLDVGRLRIREKGSAGGHNGIKSIIQHLGTENFPRIKVGIGQKTHPDMDLSDYVLGRISNDDEVKLAKAIDTAVNTIGYMVNGQPNKAMEICNRA